MADNVAEIKPVGLGPWVSPEHNTKQESPDVSAVVRVDAGVLGSGARQSEPQHDHQTQAISPEQTKALVERVQHYLAELNTRLSIEVHDKTGELVVKVINRDTNEVIRQFPPQELLKLHDQLEELRGVLFDVRV